MTWEFQDFTEQFRHIKTKRTLKGSERLLINSQITNKKDFTRLFNGEEYHLGPRPRETAILIYLGKVVNPSKF